MSAEQRAQLWQRWRAGEPVKQIATALRRPAGTIQMHIYHRGGCAPATRKRRSEALSLREREEISRGLCAERSMRQIAQALQRAPSTISREVARHGGTCHYRARLADQRAWQRASRPKPCKLAVHGPLREQVQRKLALLWSPEQIAIYLARRFKSNNSMRVSHETIYRSLFIQSRGALRRELTAYLRTQRRSRKAQQRSTGQGQILQALSIRERPAEAQDRAVPGHWEGDLLCGSKSTQIATLVERHSRFVLLVKLPAKDTATVVNALSKQMAKLPVQLRRSLTWDRGLELAEHARFTLATKMPVYFCDPRSPWQRGSNENTNGLLRQYFPKGTDLSVPSQRHLNEVAHRLNTRPRKTLGWRTPADKLNDTVAATS
jgi:IS30 family transposase